uniref:Uncharacterized protein n=1 Tax=Schizaphis graminum TaxID=13262 RepID=A0A2S2NS19_SCHGA
MMTTMIVLSLYPYNCNRRVRETIHVSNVVRNPSGECTQIYLLKRNIKADGMTTDGKYIHRSGSFTYIRTAYQFIMIYVDYWTKCIQFSICIMYPVLKSIIRKLLLCSAYHLTTPIHQTIYLKCILYLSIL